MEVFFIAAPIAMGLEIALQTEWGAQVDAVADPKNYFGKLLPQVDAKIYPIPGGIDPYGNTIFHGIQMRRFLPEWVEVPADAATAEEREPVSEIEDFAWRCRDEAPLYIRLASD